MAWDGGMRAFIVDADRLWLRREIKDMIRQHYLTVR